MELAEMTKSDREKAAEMLDVWRHQFGWSISASNYRPASRWGPVSLGLGVGITLIIAAAFVAQIIV